MLSFDASAFTSALAAAKRPLILTGPACCTKAGRERYEQLRALVARTPLSKVQAAYELGLERIRDRAPHLGEAVVPSSPN